MDPTLTFCIFQCCIVIPFCSGIALRKRFPDPADFTKKLLRINIILIEPLIALWCIWGLKLSRKLVCLPLAGLMLVLGGLVLGLLFRKAVSSRKNHRATFLVSTSLANHGFTMGGFLCYFFLGEKGLALTMLFILYFIPYIYICIFPAARALSGHNPLKKDFLKKIILDPKNMPLYALAAAVLLQKASIPRPALFVPIDALLLISISLYYFTLGITFKKISLRPLLREHLLLASIKFIALPCLTALVLSVCSLDPAIKFVILIQSCMPAAIYSVVTAVLFDLEERLASSLFVCNTIIFLVIVLPLMIIFNEYVLGII